MSRSSIIFILLIAACGMVFAFQEEDHAKNPQIPELKEMHHVIHPMWHDAYPNKDTGQLKELYPDLKGYYQKLKEAMFPEEWPDKEMHWKEGIARMGNTLTEYKQAMDDNNADELLSSARKLHDDFENLVMIINPPIPELDEFHKVLFHVYHDYLPAKDWEKVRQSVSLFEEKVKALQSTELPKWMGEKSDDFREATKNLEMAVSNLAGLPTDSGDSEWESQIEEVHEAYVTLAATTE
jgi:hypothetical protein